MLAKIGPDGVRGVAGERRMSPRRRLRAAEAPRGEHHPARGASSELVDAVSPRARSAMCGTLPCMTYGLRGPVRCRRAVASKVHVLCGGCTGRHRMACAVADRMRPASRRV